MKLYTKPFSSYIDEIDTKIQNEISSQSDAYILNVNIEDYANYFAQHFEIDTPHLAIDKVFADSHEMEISGAKFPRTGEFFHVDVHRYYKKDIIVFHIPYSGNILLLQYRPSTSNYSTPELNYDNVNKTAFIKVVDFYRDSQKIKFEYEQQLKEITGNYERLVTDCEWFNKSLQSRALNLIEKRKEKLLQRNNTLASLGIPIKKKDDVSSTFSVPNPQLRKKIVISKPVVNDKEFKAEPSLNDGVFREILKFINDVGLNLERLPSTYRGKREEDIRDHIIMTIDPNFQLGSATGETFNKTGKTDILLRYDSSVVFVAECKYWKGEKKFLETIDQLLGYLTWRNSKVAIINFVQTLEFSDILKKIKTSVPAHSNYLKYIDDASETWFNYKFHLNNDRNREIDLAIISYHLPK